MSLAIRQTNGQHILICYDEYGGYELICRLQKEHALRLGSAENRIGYAAEIDKGELGEPVPLNIRRVPVEKAGDLPWEITVGDKVAAGITDDALRSLIEFGNPVFGPGEPDWQRREIEILDFTVNSLRGNIRHIEQSINEAQQRRNVIANRISNRELPAQHDVPVGEFIALSRYLREMDADVAVDFLPDGEVKARVSPERLLPQHEAQLSDRILALAPLLREAGLDGAETRGTVTIRVDGRNDPLIQYHGASHEISLEALMDMRFEENEAPTP